MLRWLREWWNGKDVRVDPDAPDTLGGAGVMHEYRNEKHWTSVRAHQFADWHARNWSPLWTLAIAALGLLLSLAGFLVSVAGLLISYVALSRTGG